MLVWKRFIIEFTVKYKIAHTHTYMYVCMYVHVHICVSVYVCMFVLYVRQGLHFFFYFVVLCTMTIKTFWFWLNSMYTAVLLELSARIKGKVWETGESGDGVQRLWYWGKGTGVLAGGSGDVELLFGRDQGGQEQEGGPQRGVGMATLWLHFPSEWISGWGLSTDDAPSK